MRYTPGATSCAPGSVQWSMTDTMPRRLMLSDARRCPGLPRVALSALCGRPTGGHCLSKCLLRPVLRLLAEPGNHNRTLDFIDLVGWTMLSTVSWQTAGEEGRCRRVRFVGPPRSTPEATAPVAVTTA